jgi:hypothetical protein
VKWHLVYLRSLVLKPELRRVVIAARCFQSASSLQKPIWHYITLPDNWQSDMLTSALLHIYMRAVSLGAIDCRYRSRGTRCERGASAVVVGPTPFAANPYRLGAVSPTSGWIDE